MSISELNGPQTDTVAAGVDRAIELGYLTDDPETLYAAFDKVAASYEGTAGVTLADDEEVINLFGIALGEQLRLELGFEWGMLTDDYGRDLVIYAADLTPPPEEEPPLLAPINVVSQRFGPDYQPGALKAAAAQLVTNLRGQIERLGGSGSGSEQA